MNQSPFSSITFAIVTALLLAASPPSLAGLGATEKECAVEYGGPQKDADPKPIPPATVAHSYVKDGLRIEAHFMDGRAARILYKKAGDEPFLPDEFQKLLAANAGDAQWKRTPAGEFKVGGSVTTSGYSRPIGFEWERTGASAYAFESQFSRSVIFFTSAWVKKFEIKPGMTEQECTAAFGAPRENKKEELYKPANDLPHYAFQGYWLVAIFEDGKLHGFSLCRSDKSASLTDEDTCLLLTANGEGIPWNQELADHMGIFIRSDKKASVLGSGSQLIFHGPSSKENTANGKK